jgi:hypothetical protein
LTSPMTAGAKAATGAFFLMSEPTKGEEIAQMLQDEDCITNKKFHKVAALLDAALDSESSSQNTASIAKVVDSFIEKVEGHPTDVWRTDEVTGILSDLKAALATPQVQSKEGDAEK